MPDMSLSQKRDKYLNQSINVESKKQDIKYKVKNSEYILNKVYKTFLSKIPFILNSTIS